MNHPRPYEIDTDQPFYSVCDGLPNGSEKESTVRIFCCAAKKLSRWNLTQEELDEQDSSGVFTFNGLIEEGWFESSKDRGKYPSDTWYPTFHPTAKMFGRLMVEGLIYENEDEDEGEFDETPRLKLFKVRVIFQDRTKRNCWFTILHVDEEQAEDAIYKRVTKYRHVLAQRGPVDRIDVSEFEGPFVAGHIIAEER